MEKSIALAPNNPDAHALLGRIHFLHGSMEKAIRAAQAALEANPNSVANYVFLANLYEKEGNWQEAQKVYEKAHRMDPESPVVANNLAYLYIEHGGDLNLGLSLAQEAKMKLPDSPSAGNTLGWAYYKKGLHGLAITEFEDCLKKDPDNHIIRYHLGMAYLVSGQPERGEQSLQEALRLSNDFDGAASARQALDSLP